MPVSIVQQNAINAQLRALKKKKCNISRNASGLIWNVLLFAVHQQS
jgi:hypothetical protein